jgi:hypothetical protein
MSGGEGVPKILEPRSLTGSVRSHTAGDLAEYRSDARGRERSSVRAHKEMVTEGAESLAEVQVSQQRPHRGRMKWEDPLRAGFYRRDAQRPSAGIEIRHP